MTRETERTDHDRYREWLALGTGEIGALERRQLDAHLAGCAECRSERRAFDRMDDVLAERRIDVRDGFRGDVLRSLPAAGWESCAPRSWRLPVAVLLLLGAAAGLLLGLHSAQAAPGAPLAGAFGAVADAFATGALAGAGMLWASWRGVGMVLDSAVSPGLVAALVILVVCVDVLLLSLVVRRGRTRSAAGVAARPSAEPGGRRTGSGDGGP